MNHAYRRTCWRCPRCQASYATLTVFVCPACGFERRVRRRVALQVVPGSGAGSPSSPGLLPVLVKGEPKARSAISPLAACQDGLLLARGGRRSFAFSPSMTCHD